MSRTAGMYADTNAISKSAKIRLGKRKAHEDSLIEIEDRPRRRSDDKLDLTKPRRGSLEIRVDRNLSPRSQTADQIVEAKYRTIYSRSPSPPSPRLKKRRRSAQRSPSPSSPKVSKMSRLTDEDLMAMDLSDLQELISKKKKVKTKKNKKEKDEKKISKKVKDGKKKDDKKSTKTKKIKVEKKKKKLKKKESRSDSSPSPSPPPVHAKKRTKSVAEDVQKSKLKKNKDDDDQPSGLVADDLPPVVDAGNLLSGLEAGQVTGPSLLDDAELENQMKELLGE